MEFSNERRDLPRREPEAGTSPARRRRTSASIGVSRECGGTATAARGIGRGLGGLLLASFALAACEPYIQGNGVYHEEDRTGSLGPFAGVRLEEGIAAGVTAGATDRSVRVSGDANVVRYVRTEVRQETVRGAPVDVLRVWVDVPSGGYSSTYPLRATIRSPELRFAAAEGEGARMDVQGAGAAELVLEAGGEGEILVRGSGGPAVHATLADASVDAGGYPTETAEVLLTGASRLELDASVSVTGDAWGTSEVDNMLGGAGTCAVVLHDAARALCHP